MVQLRPGTHATSEGKFRRPKHERALPLRYICANPKGGLHGPCSTSLEKWANEERCTWLLRCWQ